MDGDEVFPALGDPNRRLLLDCLFERDGQTLGELTGHLPDMSRQGVMKHLRVLEAAGLVTAHKVGREKRHYLNPVPIRLIHDRWISKYAWGHVTLTRSMSTRRPSGSGRRSPIPR
jgi:DNA-binding transcriptional ArsR family regulator